MIVNTTHWNERFADLARRFEVPGATLAFWHDGEVHQFATGVLNRTTNTPATPDSLFQIGSITKVWTATQLLVLAERGHVTLETPVVDVLPEFPGDPGITMRHLLSHTSGMDGDLFIETGRGDDCLEKYVAACESLQQVFPVGTSYSYSNAGYSVAGRVIERLTGKVWDDALSEQIIEPLGLTHTCTLPEDVLRFSAAIGHDEDGKPVSRWGLMRAIGPAGLICSRAADVVAFGRAHLTPGAPLAEPEAMRRAQIALPNPYDGARQWGLGWGLDEWDGHEVLAHTGDTIGQHAALAVLPGTGTVIALLTNGGLGYEFQQALYTELLHDIHGLVVPEPLSPPDQPVTVSPEPLTGVYERQGSRITVTSHRRGLRMRTEPTGGRVVKSKPREFDLIPVTDTVFVGRDADGAMWQAVVFDEHFVHYAGRATPRASMP